MAIDNAKEVFHLLYKDIDGMAVSKVARKKLGTWYMGHTYGEITYEGFQKLLVLAKPQKNEIFYDLGSGTGKCVLLAALLTDFSHVRGVEILEDLHKTSVQVMQRYRRISSQENVPHQSIQLIQGDFQETNFSDADVIFMNATCMRYEITLPFMRKLEKLKKGTRIITNTHFFTSEYYKVTSVGMITFTWGDEECFIHEKIA